VNPRDFILPAPLVQRPFPRGPSLSDKTSDPLGLGSILSGYVRRKAISSDQAVSLQSEAESLLAGCEYKIELRTVLELVRDSDCSA
jgi:hypothetical protein